MAKERTGHRAIGSCSDRWRYTAAGLAAAFIAPIGCGQQHETPGPNDPGHTAARSVAEASTDEAADLDARDAATVTHPEPATDALLDDLEAADRGLRDLSAALVYARHDVALESLITRFGTLRYLRPDAHDDEGAPGRAVFAVEFERLIDDLGRVSDQRQLWVFDGQWLVEQDFRTKSYVRRQVAREGVDPTRLGEGPLPIPIGQRKREILDRFNVESAPVQAGLEAPDPAFGGQDVAANFRDYVRSVNARQLKLTPRHADDDGFDEIRLWYARRGDHASPAERQDAPSTQRGDQRDRLLPVLARAVRFDIDGNESDVAYVQLVNVKVNRGVESSELRAPPPSEADGWTIDIRPLAADEEGLSEATPTDADADTTASKEGDG
jgi:hypothetical protein